MPAGSRLLPLIGAYNFRDLGGYPTVDGRLTRWGRLFRSDSLHELTEADVGVLRNLGLASIIDLRTDAEVKRTGRGLLAVEPIRYLHASVFTQGGGSQGAPSKAQVDLAQRYLWYLDVGRAALVDALTIAGEPTAVPLVFHCTAGKDRSGVLAALVLDILSVERETIVEDYVLTASRMDLILARVQRESDAEARIAEIPQFRLQAEAATMVAFLDALHRDHGGARQWAIAAGVPVGSLNSMSDLLVESDDERIRRKASHPEP